MRELSGMRRKIYEYIVVYFQKQGYPPSIREIGQAVGLKSPSTVHFHLKRLKDAGMIEQGHGKRRAIALKNPTADQIPVVGDVAAGNSMLTEEQIQAYLTFPTDGLPGEYFALRVRGESMTGAGILPDDLVVVHRQSTASSGEIVVAMLESEATVKRLLWKNGRWWLMPENPLYAPVNSAYARILGKVTAVIRYY